MMDARPDPDELLLRLASDAQQAGRGRLRIYFGAAAGVGKTFAMLAAGRAAMAAGIDVLAGVVETHGRAETIAQLQGLVTLPPVQVESRGRRLPEFDLDAAIARRPALILVDELAHSNVAGSRHPKRWQDVEELLDAGIDVFTTLNVQHLESLNDVVGGITSIRVHETLPDTFFDRADEVVMVDTPADELLKRLKAGKVYMPAQAEMAARNFFRKGNLMALRELALRRTADRAGGDVRAWRRTEATLPAWQTEAAILCCIGPGEGSDHVVRSAARLAQQLGAPWQAVYVETPALQRLSAVRRDRILRSVALAEQLGATTAVLAANDMTEALIDHARHHNLSKLVVGHGHGRATRPWQRETLMRRLARRAPEFDLIEVGQGSPSRRSDPPTPWRDAAWPRGRGMVGALAVSGLTTALAFALGSTLDAANLVMLFQLSVVGVALRFGRGPAVLAAVVNVVAFDFFFVPPRMSFAVSDVQYLVTFTVMLIVGLVIGQLTAGLRFQARIASHREARSRALFEVARDMASVLATEQCVEIAERAIGREFRAEARVLLQALDDRLQPPTSGPTPGVGSASAVSSSVSVSEPDLGTAQWALDHDQPAGQGTDTLPGSAWLYLPLRAPMRSRGVLAVKADEPRLLRVPEQRRQLDTFAALVAIALERLHYVDVAQHATLQMESERLRNSLLSALSHDLRTPLASLYGLSDVLVDSLVAAPASARETAEAIRQQARRMNALVDNLLDMARLQSGSVRLNRQWQPIEEVVGIALQAIGGVLDRHVLHIDVPPGLPWVDVDAVLLERVLANLLENAAKYTPPGSNVTIGARAAGTNLVVEVSDDGPGLPGSNSEALFEKFTRGQAESSIPGVGLGLAICRAIVEAHGGRIWVEPASNATGACFRFTLPLGTPPSMPATEPEQAMISP